QLVSLFGEMRDLDISRQILRKVMKPMKGFGSAYSKWAILLLNEVSGVFEVAITGPEPLLRRKEIDSAYIPNKLMLGGETGNLPLLEGKFTGETMIYVCRDKTCQLPVREASEALKQMRSVS